MHSVWSVANDRSSGSAPVRRPGRGLRPRSRRQEGILQEVPLRAFPRGVLPAGRPR